MPQCFQFAKAVHSFFPQQILNIINMDRPTYSDSHKRRIERIWSRHGDKVSRFRETILRFSESDEFNVAIAEWKASEEDWSSDQCICSQHIENCYTYTNKVTGKILVIGSECIKKFGDDEMVKEHKLIKSDTTYKGTKRRCESCLKHNISGNKASYITKCKS